MRRRSSGISEWVQAYKTRGAASFEYAGRGRPKGGRLSLKQEQQVLDWVMDHQPDQLKLPFFLWTRKAVVQLIERRLHIQYSERTVGRLLRRLGLTPQKPARQDPVAVTRWLEHKYPLVRHQAARRGAVILWADEMGLRSDDVVGRTWSLKGYTPEVRVSGKRFGCSMLSALSNRGRLYFTVFKQAFTKSVFLDFMQRLHKQLKRPWVLIVDGHPVHRSREVAQWISAQAGRAQLVFLPPYSPELNPDELLNQDVKTNTVRKQQPKNQAELLAQVRGYLRKRQRQPKAVKRYFRASTVRYAAS
jgi:transposase